MPAAYQDENGKWWKECSTTKQLFGPVDNKEDLSEWFCKHKHKLDGFNTQSKSVHNKNSREYNSLNKEKVKEYKKSEKAKETKKKYNKYYYDKNKEVILEYQKTWHQKNCEHISKYNLNYRLNNQEKIAEYRKSARRLYSKYKYSAKRRGINFTLTLEWFEEQMKLPQFNYCAISGETFTNQPNHPLYRSLDRISSSKGYTPDNVRWVCFKFNSWKGDLTLNDVSLIFKYMAESAGYNPVEYMREVMNNNSNPHLMLEKVA